MTQHIKLRNDKLAENRNLLIDLDPEIAEAYKNSINISSTSLITLQYRLCSSYTDSLFYSLKGQWGPSLEGGFEKKAHTGRDERPARDVIVRRNRETRQSSQGHWAIQPASWFPTTDWTDARRDQEERVRQEPCARLDRQGWHAGRHRRQPCPYQGSKLGRKRSWLHSMKSKSSDWPVAIISLFEINSVKKCWH